MVLINAPAPAESLPPPTLPSRFKALCHPREPEVTEEVDGYFIDNWGFENEAAIQKFRDAGFSRVTCFYFPKALDDRIHFGCRLLTVLFLIDDLLEDMSLEDGKAYNENLIPISRGDVLPDRTKPAEFILYDLWESMRAHDRELADEILEPVFTFMRAQVDPARTDGSVRELGPYLEYREKDVGKALLAALMRYTMALHITPEELDSVEEIEKNVSKHLSVVNDIFSWEKEVLASRSGHVEGSALCSSVQVMAAEAEIETGAAKRVLWSMCREWERRHVELEAAKKKEKPTPSNAVFTYIKGLEYQMSGNEAWSETTKRYVELPEFVNGQ
ncbi:MAG: hypothetical protein LQ351_000068 [Letrouitia transgressa]|nr:MAG: hypothetical protein LQ351_000068 [Letrouitia transgressa]